MKTHTSAFKEQIKLAGRQIDSIITYGNTTLHEELWSVTPVFETSLLKSAMKQLDVESSVDIPKNTVINCRIGLLVNGTYEYLNFGNYVVYDSEKQEDTNTYKITCFDKMLYSMKQNEDLGITYPITVKNYLTALAVKIGLTVASGTFQNQDRQIPSELYVGLDYTYRDILDEIAQVTGSIICINSNDEIEVRYPNYTNDTIEEEYLKDVNVKFGAKYGPINSVVLSRAGESDNVYLRDETSVATNGLCEVKIVDNQIMNDNNRSDYLQGILNALNGIYYFINDYTSTGILYYDIYDVYGVTVGENTYQCMMLNDEINITSGIKEIIYTDMPEQSETDYSKADKTDRRINNAYIIVNKQNQTIEAVAERTDIFEDIIENVEQKQTKYEQDAERVRINVNNILQNGVNRVETSTGFIFDKDGLKINKTGAETGTIVDEAGIHVIDKTGSSQQDLLYAGYVKEGNTKYSAYIGQTIVAAANMIVENFLVIPNSRFEAYVNPVLGGHGTGAFEV